MQVFGRYLYTCAFLTYMRTFSCSSCAPSEHYTELFIGYALCVYRLASAMELARRSYQMEPLLQLQIGTMAFASHRADAAALPRRRQLCYQSRISICYSRISLVEVQNVMRASQTRSKRSYVPKKLISQRIYQSGRWQRDSSNHRGCQLPLLHGCCLKRARCAPLAASHIQQAHR